MVKNIQNIFCSLIKIIKKLNINSLCRFVTSKRAKMKKKILIKVIQVDREEKREQKQKP